MLDQLREALKGQYDVDAELGGGGMSRVFAATDVKLRRRIVIKVLPPDLSSTLSVDRFEREIHLAARLRHPHIVPLLDAGKAGDLLYYTMPLIEGESLRKRIKRGPLSADEARRLTAEVADALSYAHGNGVVHRDIKPENILLDSGHAVVTDFGIAHAISESGLNRMTETGYSLGTPGYMSPEQATGDKAIDGRSDVYSLGCVLYEMLSGKPPVAAGLGTPSDEVRGFGAVVPVLSRALAHDRDDRFASAQAFRDALQSPGLLTRRRQQRIMAAAGVIVAATALGAFAMGRRGADAASPANWTRQRVSFVGDAADPALAPDGSSVAYRSASSIYVTDLRSGDTRQISTGDRLMRSIMWTTGGSEIAYQSRDTAYAVPAGGGAPRVLIDHVTGYFAVSLDGRSLAWEVSQQGAQSMLVRTPRLKGERRFRTLGFTMAWSPDGRYLAGAVFKNFRREEFLAGKILYDLVVVSPEDSTTTVVATTRGFPSVRWDGDNTICATRLSIDSTRVGPGCVRRKGSSWTASRETFMLDDPVYASSTGFLGRGAVSNFDPSVVGGRVAYVEPIIESRLWEYKLEGDGAISNRVRVTPASMYARAYDESAAGTRAFVAHGYSGFDVYVQAIGASKPERVSRLSASRMPALAWSPDGSRIAAMVLDDSISGVYVVDPANGQSRRLAPGIKASFPSGQLVVWTRDGKEVLAATDTGLLRIDVATGRSAVIAKIRKGVVVSPSGTEVAGINGDIRLERVGLRRNSEDTVRASPWRIPLRWNREGEMIVALDSIRAPQQLWRTFFDGRKPVSLAKLAVNCGDLWVSPDLKRVVCAEVERATDVWVATRQPRP